MSGLHEDLLGPRITKKRVISLIIISAILISAFAYSVVIFSWFFGSPRLNPNDPYNDAEPEYPILNQPPIPWDLQDLFEYLSNLGEVPDDYIDQMLDLLDGNIDELDLSDLADLLSLIAFSDIEVFRIYDYDNFGSLLDNLWKYEAFEGYTGTSWDSSFGLDFFNFLPSSIYSSKYSSQDLLLIAMLLSPNDLGTSSFMIPSLFPNPYVIEDSVSSSIINPNNTIIRKNELNSTALAVDITDTNPDYLYYNMFGLDVNTLNDMIPYATKANNNTAEINSTYLQLPPTINSYINDVDNDKFRECYYELQTIITSTDNVAQTAIKIKQYLEDNFIFNLNASENNPQGPNEDNVNWFCTYREGVWSDFATAFTVFSRAFGIASRFVTGFQTRFAEENTTYGYVPIKYRDMYSWSEVYVPFTSSEGQWIQVDVCENIDPTATASNNYTLTLLSNFTSGHRNSSNFANITAILNHPTASVENRPINFQDEYMNENLGTILTDQNGIASVIININDSQSVGIHAIFGYFSIYAANFTTYTVYGDIPSNDLNLTISLQSNSDINLDIDPTVTINGSLFDPLNGKLCRYCYINYTLIDKISQIPIIGVLSPSVINTDSTGTFYDLLSINPSIPAGEYELQANFTGFWEWGYDLLINATSNKIDLNITKAIDYDIWFYINNFDAYDYYNPEISRYSTIELKSRVIDEFGTPQSGVTVNFFNATNNIGFSTTNGSGWALFYYYVNSYIPAGPNLMYARFSGKQNSTYYILNENIIFSSMSSFPNPYIVSRISGYSNSEFLISGYLRDIQSHPIRNAILSVHMYDGLIDVTAAFLNTPSSIITDQNGYFYIVCSVASNTPLQNYTIELVFNGDFDYSPTGPYFNFPGHPNFSDIVSGTNDLVVVDPDQVEIYLNIESTPTRTYYNDANPPYSYIQGQDIFLEVWIFNQTIPVTYETVSFYDEDQGHLLLDSHPYDGYETPLGYFATNISTTGWSAGIHEITVHWGSSSVFNSTFIIINKSVNFNIPLSSQTITRGSEPFTIDGTIQDGSIGLRGLEVEIILLNEFNQDYSYLLNFEIGYSQTMSVDDNGDFEFRINNIDQSIPYGAYKIRIDFNGTIYINPYLDLHNFIINSSSTPIDITVTAGTSLSGFYNRTFIPFWYLGDTCEIYGNLKWDNGTGISNVYVQVYVFDGSMDVLNSTIVLTNSLGNFNTSFVVGSDWDENTEIWIYFYPSDTYIPPESNYIEESSQEFFLQI
ncbi:MAG: transglutaminase domain-containing protein [Candidatus Lokiarchaeota archaeon]|nr:transglutaminase domain-containing protein [Candidatus Lokiarchaeota archaeon]